MHERGQSSLYFGKDYSKEFDYLNDDSYTHMKTLEMTLVQKMKLSRYDCDESNSQMFVDCINEYYEEKLNCNLPWINRNSENPQKTCASDKDYEEYLDISTSIFQSQVRKEIENKGCFVPNCIQNFWKVKTSREIIVPNQEKTDLLFLMPGKKKIMARKEVPLYTFSTFFAEVGGYLGLLVGESLYSFYERGLNILSKLKKQKY